MMGTCPVTIFLFFFFFIEALFVITKNIEKNLNNHHEGPVTYIMVFSHNAMSCRLYKEMILRVSKNFEKPEAGLLQSL